MDQTFTISSEYIELNKLLKATGLCSTGGQAKMLIEDRSVLVDDEIETRIRRKIKKGMTVKYDNNSIKVVYEK
jgi:ribosome-associated protein